jgi:hypothetical protein
MRKIAEEISRIRRRGLARKRKAPKTISWRERDYLEGEVTAGVVILPTRGCAWGLAGGCAMCGYVYDSSTVSQDRLLRDFRQALKKLGEVEYLKIFNSGSFFDERELARETAFAIFEEVNRHPRIKRLQVEARPEYLDGYVLRESADLLNASLEVGIGFETVSDYIRDNCINKGVTLRDLRRAMRRCRESGVEVKAYILVKPPFLTEREGIEDAVRSGVAAHKYGADRISLNPVSVHRDTLVEMLWRRGEYSPPWLWSLVEVMQRLMGRISVPVLCHPTGAGKARGAHNCGKCDHRVFQAIVSSSATQKYSHLEKVVDAGCSCREPWRTQLILEGFAQGSFPEDLRKSLWGRG